MQNSFLICRKHLFSVLVIIVSCYLSPKTIVAQKHEMGLGFGLTNYKGDLATSVNWQNTSGGASLFYRMNISKSVSWKSNFSLGNIRASDKYGNQLQQKRNFNFSSFFAQATSVIEYNFFDMRFPKSTYKYSPYLFCGLGIANYIFESNNQDAQLPATQVLLPLGVGIKKEVNRNMNISIDFTTFKTFTDDLDGLANESTQQLPQGYRGFFSNADMYYMVSFSVSYVFYGITCPKHYKSYMIPPSELGAKP